MLDVALTALSSALLVVGLVFVLRNAWRHHKELRDLRYPHTPILHNGRVLCPDHKGGAVEWPCEKVKA